MRILISNDDGIDAEGIKVLERAALTLFKDVWVVAPEFEQSGKAHAFTARDKMTVKQRDDRHFAIGGTPTDCILYACNALLKDHRPDVILSGVNHGANLGFDVTYSGTTGAAIEGTLQKIKSFAFSLDGVKEGRDEWATAEAFIPEIIKRYVMAKWLPYTFLNINIPSMPINEIAGIELTTLSHRKIGDAVECFEDGCFRIGFNRSGLIKDGTDIEAITRGAISVSPIRLELTNHEQLDLLKSLIY